MGVIPIISNKKDFVSLAVDSEKIYKLCSTELNYDGCGSTVERVVVVRKTRVQLPPSVLDIN
jgi:hypothetical protein